MHVKIFTPLLLFSLLQCRAGEGAIWVWAAGNGGGPGTEDSCAADGYVNSIYTIAIGAARSDGSHAVYDERCSAKMAVTLMESDTWIR